MTNGLYTPVTYKFTYGTGPTYESSSPKLTTLDSGPNDYNRLFNLPNGPTLTLPVVVWDDIYLNDMLPADTAVLFSVDMNGAVGTDAHAFDPNAGDTVWINGPFLNWNWWTGANPMDVQYQMIAAGGGIYTNTLVFPKGSGINFAYKYGIGLGASGDQGPRDNEYVGGIHQRVIRTTASGSYTMAQDKFGTMYAEPFFRSQAKADGQLTVGARSGGTVPVTWLGRPGAHLQSAGSLTGPWTDHPETDGGTWTSGSSSTNGFVSQTNWPSLGNQYFRLVKP
jgi:hypothetical protein